jgi:hypothetical protein
VTKPPKFAPRSALVRYIHPIHRMRHGRVSDAAFRPNPDEAYLSVNSLEIETLKEIVSFYGRTFIDADVIASQHTVSTWNIAAQAAGVSVRRDDVRIWAFTLRGEPHQAYSHRPNTRMGSMSHCGVETIQAMDNLMQSKFAHRLSKHKTHRPRFSTRDRARR